MRRRRLIEEAARLQGQTDAIVAALDEYLAGLDPADRQREVNAVWLEPPITQAEAQTPIRRCQTTSTSSKGT